MPSYFLFGPGHHDRRVPADDPADAALHLLVAREPRLVLGGDGVDVVGLDHGRDADLEMLGVGQHLADDVPGPARSLGGDQVVERFEPLSRLVGIDVGKLLEEGVEGHLSSLRGVLTIVPPQSLLELGFQEDAAAPGAQERSGDAPLWIRGRPGLASKPTPRARAACAIVPALWSSSTADSAAPLLTAIPMWAWSESGTPPSTANGSCSAPSSRSATRAGVGRAVEVVEQGAELVVAEAGEGVRRADQVLQPLGDLHHQPVAGGLAHPLLDRGDRPGQVDDHDRHRVDVPRAPVQGVLDPVVEQHPARQVGERVAEGVRRRRCPGRGGCHPAEQLAVLEAGRGPGRGGRRARRSRWSGRPGRGSDPSTASSPRTSPPARSGIRRTASSLLSSPRIRCQPPGPAEATRIPPSGTRMRRRRAPRRPPPSPSPIGPAPGPPRRGCRSSPAPPALGDGVAERGKAVVGGARRRGRREPGARRVTAARCCTLVG